MDVAEVRRAIGAKAHSEVLRQALSFDGEHDGFWAPPPDDAQEWSAAIAKDSMLARMDDAAVRGLQPVSAYSRLFGSLGIAPLTSGAGAGAGAMPGGPGDYGDPMERPLGPGAGSFGAGSSAFGASRQLGGGGGGIAVVPVGFAEADKKDQDFIFGVRTSLSAHWWPATATEHPVRSLDASRMRIVPSRAGSRGREYSVRAIEDMLARALEPGSASVVVAVSAVPLFVPGSKEAAMLWHRVSGSRVPTVVVDASALVDPLSDPDSVSDRLQQRRRTHKMVNFAVAQLLGMSPCSYLACALNAGGFTPRNARWPEALDATPLVHCPVCLRKITLVLGSSLDITKRYKAMGSVFDSLDLGDAYRWVDERLAILTGQYGASVLGERTFGRAETPSRQLAGNDVVGSTTVARVKDAAAPRSRHAGDVGDVGGGGGAVARQPAGLPLAVPRARPRRDGSTPGEPEGRTSPRARVGDGRDRGRRRYKSRDRDGAGGSRWSRSLDRERTGDSGRVRGSARDASVASGSSRDADDDDDKALPPLVPKAAGVSARDAEHLSPGRRSGGRELRVSVRGSDDDEAPGGSAALPAVISPPSQGRAVPERVKRSTVSEPNSPVSLQHSKATSSQSVTQGRNGGPSDRVDMSKLKLLKRKISVRGSGLRKTDSSPGPRRSPRARPVSPTAKDDNDVGRKRPSKVAPAAEQEPEARGKSPEVPASNSATFGPSSAGGSPREEDEVDFAGEPLALHTGRAKHEGPRAVSPLDKASDGADSLMLASPVGSEALPFDSGPSLAELAGGGLDATSDRGSLVDSPTFANLAEPAPKVVAAAFPEAADDIGGRASKADEVSTRPPSAVASDAGSPHLVQDLAYSRSASPVSDEHSDG